MPVLKGRRPRNLSGAAETAAPLLSHCYGRMREHAAFPMSRAKSFWKTVPRTSFVGFLLGVFFIFSTMGLTTDIMEMGREPTLRFLFRVFLPGLFPMFYPFPAFL